MSWLFFSLCFLSNVALASTGALERATLPDSLVQVASGAQTAYALQTGEDLKVADALRSEGDALQVAESLRSEGDALQAADTVQVADSLRSQKEIEQVADTVQVADSLELSRYERRMKRYSSVWQSLQPSQFIMQNAGNMGLLSFGLGWNYGKRNQWETHLLFGWIPKYKGHSVRMTMTLKETYIPWNKRLGEEWRLEPLTVGLYANTVFGKAFWRSQPSRYPDKYYQFLSTRVRLNVFLGQRITVIIPNNKRKFVKSMTAFYELSTCDLYIRCMFQDSSVKLKDIVGLSLGLKMQIM